MSPVAVTNLLMRLSERDLAILESLRTYRLLSTALIRRLHFGESHATLTAASGATMRVLTRLEALHLTVRLPRRIGGVRAGSSGIVWQLGPTGERLLRTMHGDTHRRRYQVPSPVFAAHTLAVAELAVTLHELARDEVIELISLSTEPSCWQSFVGPLGTREWLKPDLTVVTANGDYEEHRFAEVDLATEHLPVVLRKARTQCRLACLGNAAVLDVFPGQGWLRSFMFAGASWRVPCWPGFFTG